MQTPTELLIKCIEDFGESEATVAVVVYRQENGDIACRGTEGASSSEIVGMLACAHAVLVDQLVQQARKAE